MKKLCFWLAVLCLLAPGAWADIEPPIQVELKVKGVPKPHRPVKLVVTVTAWVDAPKVEVICQLPQGVRMFFSRDRPLPTPGPRTDEPGQVTLFSGPLGRGKNRVLTLPISVPDEGRCECVAGATIIFPDSPWRFSDAASVVIERGSWRAVPKRSSASASKLPPAEGEKGEERGYTDVGLEP